MYEHLPIILNIQQGGVCPAFLTSKETTAAHARKDGVMSGGEEDADGGGSGGQCWARPRDHLRADVDVSAGS